MKMSGALCAYYVFLNIFRVDNLIYIHWQKKFQTEHYLNLSIHFVEIFDGKKLLWEIDFEKF